MEGFENPEFPFTLENTRTVMDKRGKTNSNILCLI